MEHIHRLAWVSIARGCGFGVLGIVTMMFAFITTPGIAFDCGGFGFLLMAVILMIKSNRSDHLSHKRTEIWLLLAPEHRPPPDVACDIIMRVRAEVLLRCAHLSAMTALGCLSFAALVQVAGYR
jgi:hypothetical protein